MEDQRWTLPRIALLTARRFRVRFSASQVSRIPAEGVWAHLKKSLANLAACTTRQLASKARTRLKKMQYRADLLDGFIAETGLILPRPERHPPSQQVSVVCASREFAPPSRRDVHAWRWQLRSCQGATPFGGIPGSSLYPGLAGDALIAIVSPEVAQPSRGLMICRFGR
ncbi:hypothetical protein GCM10020000_33380 [Streptomyces olivoverticillatus]